MVIKNKVESINVINELGLNKFPEQLFKKNENDKIKKFIKEYPAKYYAIRDREKPGGVFKLKVEKDNIFDEIKNYNLFSINVSSANYVKNQLYFIPRKEQSQLFYKSLLLALLIESTIQANKKRPL